MNPYHVGAGGTLTIWLNVIILAFFWRFLSAKLAGSDNPRIATIGGAMGATL